MTEGKVSSRGQERFKELSDNERWKDLFPRLQDQEKALADLRADLTEVPVLLDNGKVSDAYAKIEAAPFSRKDKDLIWHCLALVRESYLKLEDKAASQNAVQETGPSGYQWNMNWKHCRAELDQVLEASRLLNLSPDETRDALIASIFSDAVKNRGNFIVHNIHGAQAAALVLSYYFNPECEAEMQSYERIVLAIKQHQIAPPEFMARTVAIMLTRKFKLDSFDKIISAGNTADLNRNKQNRRVVSIYTKIRSPYQKQHLTADLLHIDFSDEEREMLKEIGTPDKIPHYIERAKDKNDPFRLMGFGHRVYKNYDPRAKIMQKMCHAVLKETGHGDDPMLKVAMELEKIALSDQYFIDRKLYPNVDFYSGITLKAMGFPVSMFTVLFALARTVGWIAQWEEMTTDNTQRIGRPRQIYTGAPQRDYVAIGGRK